MNITLDDIKRYKNELNQKETNNKIIKAIYHFDEIGPTFILKMMLVTYTIGFISTYIYGSNALLIPIFFSFFVLVCILLNASIISFLDSRKMISKLAEKISKGVYKGFLSEIFDLDCEITKGIIKPEKEELTKLIFDKKGIPGDVIVNLLYRINSEKQKQDKEQKDKEEREALISAGTPIGSILKEVSEI
jgi:hypothetical protein